MVLKLWIEIQFFCICSTCTFSIPISQRTRCGQPDLRSTALVTFLQNPSIHSMKAMFFVTKTFFSFLWLLFLVITRKVSRFYENISRYYDFFSRNYDFLSRYYEKFSRYYENCFSLLREKFSLLREKYISNYHFKWAISAFVDFHLKQSTSNYIPGVELAILSSVFFVTCNNTIKNFISGGCMIHIPLKYLLNFEQPS